MKNDIKKANMAIKHTKIHSGTSKKAPPTK